MSIKLRSWEGKPVDVETRHRWVYDAAQKMVAGAPHHTTYSGDSIVVAFRKPDGRICVADCRLRAERWLEAGLDFNISVVVK